MENFDERTVDEEITRIRTELREADRRGVDELLPLIYDELRRLASGYLRGERAGHTLQTTALVHEAYARLAKNPETRWHDRAHFFRVAAKTMRHILINHAVKHRAQKRGGGRAVVTLDEVTAAMPGREVDLEALDEALNRLAENDDRKARVVELRFFGGCTIEETAAALGVSARTVEREWRFARAWLEVAISGDGD